MLCRRKVYSPPLPHDDSNACTHRAHNHIHLQLCYFETLAALGECAYERGLLQEFMDSQLLVDKPECVNRWVKNHGVELGPLYTADRRAIFESILVWLMWKGKKE